MSRIQVIDPASGATVEVEETSPQAEQWQRAPKELATKPARSAEK